MYDQGEDDEGILPDGEEVTPTPMTVRPLVDFAASGKYVTITIDGKPITVPNAHYTASLERKLADSDRANLQLKAQVKAMRQLVNRHESDINDIWRELDRKLSVRDV